MRDGAQNALSSSLNVILSLSKIVKPELDTILTLNIHQIALYSPGSSRKIVM